MADIKRISESKFLIPQPEQFEEFDLDTARQDLQNKQDFLEKMIEKNRKDEEDFRQSFEELSNKISEFEQLADELPIEDVE